MGGTAAGVDVLPVRLGADRDHVGTRPPQQDRGQFRCRAVRTVDHDPHARQRRGAVPRDSRGPPSALGHRSSGHRGTVGLPARAARPGGEQVGEVAFPLATSVMNPAKADSGLARTQPARIGQPCLDLVFSGVGQLETAPREQLDSVVGRRVVAG